MDINESINDTRKGFEESFAEAGFYNRQTQDSEHLNKILEPRKHEIVDFCKSM